MEALGKGYSLIGHPLVAQGLSSLATILVALLVAYFAFRRDAKSSETEKFSKFLDETKGQYASFIRSMNVLVGAIWDYTEAPSAQAKKTLNASALDLDTQTYLVHLSAPYEVASYVRLVNGSLQTAALEVEGGNNGRAALDTFEKIKPKVLDAMKVDLQFVEQSQSRKNYEKMLESRFVAKIKDSKPK